MSEYIPDINEAIMSNTVKVIGKNGEQLGQMSTKEALQLARKKRLDLVQVTRKVFPPICRIMNYNKFIGDATRKSPGFKRRSNCD